MMEKTAVLQGATFRMKTYATFAADIAKTAFEKATTGLPAYIAFVFAVIEGHLIEITLSEGASLEAQVIAAYMAQRSKLTMDDRVNLFNETMNYEATELLIKAFEATRDKSLDAEPELQRVDGDENFTEAASGQ